MTAIAAVCENGGIGREGALLFHIRRTCGDSGS